MKILITGGSSGLGKRIVEILSMSKENFITGISEKNINLILKQNIVIEIHDIKSLNK